MKRSFRKLATTILLGLSVTVAIPNFPQLQARAESIAPLHVQRQIAARDLLYSMGMLDLYEIMRAEGIDYAATIETDMFPGRGGQGWASVVEGIYDTDRMNKLVTDTFVSQMGDADLAALTEFFDSDLGRRIVGLEISARRALLDKAVEELSKDTLHRMSAASDPRLTVLRDFVEVNDLVETNVVGALNSNFAFFLGLQEGGAFEASMTEDEMLRDVWQQEPAIRLDTEEWIYSYLALAYQPLSDEDITTYTELSRTKVGQLLNTGLFAAFDVLFVAISRDLGKGAAGFMIAEDI